MPRLLTIDEAAAELGVKPGSLERAAKRHGLLVRMERSIRINPDDIPELIRRCQDQPRAPASTAGATVAASTSSATAAEKSQQALQTAEELKALSRDTSRRRTGPKADVIPLK